MVPAFFVILCQMGYTKDEGMIDDSPDDPGVFNAWDSSDARGAFGGGPSRGA